MSLLQNSNYLSWISSTMAPLHDFTEKYAATKNAIVAI